MVVDALTEDGARCRDPDDPDGAEREIEIELVAPEHPGDRVLVHAGVAIARLGVPA
jgi:hydrogenase maturation factor